MQFKKTLEIKANHKQVVINVADILYIKASVNDCYIHVTSGSVYKTRSTLEAMEAQVGEYFLKSASYLSGVYHGNPCIRRYADTYQWRRTQLCNTQEKGNPCTAAGEAEKAYSNLCPAEHSSDPGRVSCILPEL